MAKLNHPPFNDWLLSGEALNAEQTRSLYEHLRACPECSRIESAWSEVQQQFKVAGQTAPVPGFTQRWQTRLERRRAHQQRRNAWFLCLGAALMAGLILSFVGGQILQRLSSPSIILTSLVYLWSNVMVLAEKAPGFLWTATRFLPSITLVGLVFFVGFCSLVSVLWLVTFRKLTQARRMTTW